MIKTWVKISALATLLSPIVIADDKPTPGNEATARIAKMGLKLPADIPTLKAGDMKGPYKRLVIRGATLIDGTGAPPRGPVDIVIINNKIDGISSVGNPGVPINPKYRPAKGDYEIDAHGSYVLPGFVDAHSHIGNPGWGLPNGTMPSMEYILKLWLAHGITNSREVSCGLGLDYTLKQAKKTAANKGAGPRLYPYCAFPSSIKSPEAARKWVRGLKKGGASGIKVFGGQPKVLAALFDEAKKQGLRTAFHHAQMSVTRTNVLDSARMGLNSMEHWYGLPEALFEDRIVQDYPLDYNYNNEQNRFGEAGKLWKQAAKKGSNHYEKVMKELLSLDFTLNPTFTIYEANRDVMRSRNADWHDSYTLPSMWTFFQPNRVLHGSYHFDWTTEDEINWKRNFRIWMRFINDYKNRGGRVTVGSDSGFIFKLFGFDYIREFELLQEAGFHPLEVLKSATLNGAELLGIDDQYGSVEPGKIADLVIVDENPIRNFKVLYGTGHMKLNDETGKVERVGGVKYTIKDGVIYDAVKLRAEVRALVEEAKKQQK
ncbi:amidohydrolase family protein [Temperatibacter marinus]|uniref:Amidohydrolase family protein n=1 Tax=Temperatibacter marinus TaxID=1456591 RepID=A0AA52HBG1_9PROT|nr:amidohydrolase family protein [Temperatibacter marinus]WND03608.1 amidohydrolase family protein [Temperatibacter marinus]